MKATLMIALALGPLAALAEPVIYQCDTRKDVCSDSGTCHRMEFAMAFALDVELGSASAILSQLTVPLTPVDQATLTFEAEGMTFQFVPQPDDTLRVQLNTIVETEHLKTEVTCPQEQS